jgi:RHS repeat-associated protein
LKNDYLYNGKELQYDFGLGWYDYGARFYDAVVGRFHTLDPLSEKYSFQSPFVYGANNPIRFVDWMGMSVSPYFDNSGNFLGVDENGFSGKIFITTKQVFDENSTNGIANSVSIQKNDITKSIKNSYISEKAQAKIATRVLSESSEFNTSLLHNESISISSGKEKNGIIQGYNDPINASRLRTNSDDFNGEINVTALSGEINELGTVEAIQNYVGVHELNGHGVKGYTGGRNQGGTHYKAYLDQSNHRTFNSLDKEQQMEIWYRAGTYMYNENRELYNYHQKKNDSFFKNYRKAYYYFNN